MKRTPNWNGIHDLAWLICPWISVAYILKFERGNQAVFEMLVNVAVYAVVVGKQTLDQRWFTYRRWRQVFWKELQ